MEVLRLHGYTEPEKVEIAKQFLVIKQLAAGWLDRQEHQVLPTTPSLPSFARSRREAGVRNLEREIGNVCRKIARKVVKEGPEYKIVVTGENIGDFLGVIKFRDTLANEKSEVGPGHRPGLDRSWRLDPPLYRSYGGRRQGQADPDRKAGRRHAGVGAGRHVVCAPRALPASECLATSTATSTSTCTCRKAPSRKMGRRPAITIATAIASALSKIPVRRDLAMTGEITLRGKVLRSAD